MENEGDRQVERSEKVKDKKHIIKYKQPIMPIVSGVLQPGTHEISFNFVLPEHLPASMNFKFTKNRYVPKAKVKYSVKAILKTNHKHDEMKNKQVLIIREKPVPFKQND